MGNPKIEIPKNEIEAFCHKWRIKELSLFGSVLRDDFGPDSDVDILVSFVDGVKWRLFDLIHMEEELSAMFGKNVDLVDRRSVEESRNYIRQRHILGSLKEFYVAG